MFTFDTNATTSKHRFIYDGISGDLFCNSDGTGENEQVRVAWLSSGLNLGSDDLFVGI